MAKEETVEAEETSKTWITASFDKGDETLSKYSKLKNVAGIGPKEIVKAGVDMLYNSPEFKQKVKSFLADMNLNK